MKRKRFSEEQIIRILNEAEKGGHTIQEFCRQEGITEQTFYHWRKRYSGMSVSEVQHTGS